MAEPTNAVGVSVAEASVRAGEDRERARRRLDLVSRKGAPDADAGRLAEEVAPPLQLLAHELVAVDAPFGAEAAGAQRRVRHVEPVHDVSPLQVDRTQVLK